jgi:hypothetical protein
VLFSSGSPEIAPAGTTGAVFVRDRSAGTTELVSVLPDGTVPTNASPAGMNADGRYVAFDSGGNLYVRDRVNETTEFVATTTGWFAAAMTADGSEIAFVSADSTLVPGDTNNYPDVFVRNLVTGATERVNLSPSGQQESGNLFNVNATRVSMSRDGRYVAFWSMSSNMVTFGKSGVFIRDRLRKRPSRRVSASARHRRTATPSVKVSVTMDYTSRLSITAKIRQASR